MFDTCKSNFAIKISQIKLFELSKVKVIFKINYFSETYAFITYSFIKLGYLLTQTFSNSLSNILIKEIY